MRVTGFGRMKTNELFRFLDQISVDRRARGLLMIMTTSSACRFRGFFDVTGLKRTISEMLMLAIRPEIVVARV